jgi:hypothetical protein
MAQLLSNTTIANSSIAVRLVSEVFDTSSNSFTLSTVVDSNNILVIVGGVLESNFSVSVPSGNTIVTLSDSYVENIPVEIRYLSN